MNESELKKLVLELIDVAEPCREKLIFDILNKELPDPSWSDYIFHSSEFFNYQESDVDGFLNKVFEYKPVLL